MSREVLKSHQLRVYGNTDVDNGGDCDACYKASTDSCYTGHSVDTQAECEDRGYEWCGGLG